MVDDNSLPVIQIEHLREVLSMILDHIIHDLKVEAVPIQASQDFYWDMDQSDLYNVRNVKPVLDLGRLSDDWGFLANMSSDRGEAVALMLIHAAPLLRYIGEKIAK